MPKSIRGLGRMVRVVGAAGGRGEATKLAAEVLTWREKWDCEGMLSGRDGRSPGGADGSCGADECASSEED